MLVFVYWCNVKICLAVNVKFVGKLKSVRNEKQGKDFDLAKYALSPSLDSYHKTYINYLSPQKNTKREKKKDNK